MLRRINDGRTSTIRNGGQLQAVKNNRPVPVMPQPGTPVPAVPSHYSIDPPITALVTMLVINVAATVIIKTINRLGLPFRIYYRRLS